MRSESSVIPFLVPGRKVWLTPTARVPNCWMDQDETLHGGRPRPVHIVLDGDPALPRKRGTAPNFRPMSIVVKRSPFSSTAEHLLKLSTFLLLFERFYVFGLQWVISFTNS